MEIEILSAELTDTGVAVHGMVEGRGYRVSVPLADLPEKGDAERQECLARALCEADRGMRLEKLPLTGKLKLDE